MLIRQSKNAFIRVTEHYGYITNQLTCHDRTYNQDGSIWLRQITRNPQDIDDIVNNLLKEYEDAEFSELKKDFLEFASSLAHDKFVLLGENEKELDEKDIDFSYEMDNPKTLVDNYYQMTDEVVPESTQDFFLSEVQGRPLISSLQFELSSRCNERCIHCYIPNSKKNHGIDMPYHLFKRIVDEFADMGGINVTLSGGEAFLHKDLMKMINYCREKDLKISVLSNLISLKDEHIPILKKANLSLIQVSLYSMIPSIHDTITTVKGSFYKTKEAIEKLVKADIPVQISCPLMKANKNGYKDVMDYAHSLKIKAQTDYILMARSDLETDNLANRLSIEETADVIRDIVRNDIDYKEQTLHNIPISEQMSFDFEKFKTQPVCGVGYDNCCITANGDVYPCAGWQDYILGNVYKESLKDIWETSEKIIKLREITEASFPQCLECEARDYCARCLVRNYNESNGDMFAVNHHFCKVAFENKRIVEEEFGEELNLKEENYRKQYLKNS